MKIKQCLFCVHSITPSFQQKWNCVLLTYLLHGAESFLKSQLVLQLIKKFPAFYAARKFITILTSARHLSLSWANSIQSPQPLPTSSRSILILSSHLRLGLPKAISIYKKKTVLQPTDEGTKLTCRKSVYEKHSMQQKDNSQKWFLSGRKRRPIKPVVRTRRSGVKPPNSPSSEFGVSSRSEDEGGGGEGKWRRTDADCLYCADSFSEEHDGEEWVRCQKCLKLAHTHTHTRLCELSEKAPFECGT